MEEIFIYVDEAGSPNMKVLEVEKWRGISK